MYGAGGLLILMEIKLPMELIQRIGIQMEIGLTISSKLKMIYWMESEAILVLQLDMTTEQQFEVKPFGCFISKLCEG